MLTRASKEAEVLIKFMVLGSNLHQLEASPHGAISDGPVSGKVHSWVRAAWKDEGQIVLRKPRRRHGRRIHSDFGLGLEQALGSEGCEKPLLAPGISAYEPM